MVILMVWLPGIIGSSSRHCFHSVLSRWGPLPIVWITFVISCFVSPFTMFPAKTHLEAKSRRVFWNHNHVFVEISLEFHRYVLSSLHGTGAARLLRKPCWCSNWTTKASHHWWDLSTTAGQAWLWYLKQLHPPYFAFSEKKCVHCWNWFCRNFVFPLFTGMICGSVESAKTSLLHYVLSHCCWANLVIGIRYPLHSTNKCITLVLDWQFHVWQLSYCSQKGHPLPSSVYARSYFIPICFVFQRPLKTHMICL